MYLCFKNWEKNLKGLMFNVFNKNKTPLFGFGTRIRLLFEFCFAQSNSLAIEYERLKKEPMTFLVSLLLLMRKLIKKLEQEMKII